MLNQDYMKGRIQKWPLPKQLFSFDLKLCRSLMCWELGELFVQLPKYPTRLTNGIIQITKCV